MHSLTNRRITLAAALAVPFMAASPAAAQSADSAFAVSRNGISLFRVNVDGGTTFVGEYDGSTNPGEAPVEGAGARMMWYPQRAAFRAGYVSGNYFDDLNTGNWSVAIGYDARAQGAYSMAFGLRPWAFAQASFAAGEDVSATGASSVALGYHAHTNARQGSFVFSDRSSVDSLRAGVNHSANWRVSGGFRIFTASNLTTGVTIQSGASISNWGQSSAVISTSTGAMLTTGGVWQNASDVNRKHRFQPVSGEDVLARLRTLPIRSWSYRAESETVRHIGPTSQDFRAAFGLGSDDRSIGTVDADGVALAGVKALDARTLEQARTIAEQRRTIAAQQRTIEAQGRELANLQGRLERIEAALASQGTAPRP